MILFFNCRLNLVAWQVGADTSIRSSYSSTNWLWLLRYQILRLGGRIHLLLKLCSILVFSKIIVHHIVSRWLQEGTNIKLRGATEWYASLIQNLFGKILLIINWCHWRRLLHCGIIFRRKCLLYLFPLIRNEIVNFTLGDCYPILGLPFFIEFVPLLIFEHIFIHWIILILVVIFDPTFE